MKQSTKAFLVMAAAITITMAVAMVIFWHQPLVDATPQAEAAWEAIKPWYFGASALVHLLVVYAFWRTREEWSW